MGPMGPGNLLESDVLCDYWTIGYIGYIGFLDFWIFGFLLDYYWIIGPFIGPLLETINILQLDYWMIIGLS